MIQISSNIKSIAVLIVICILCFGCNNKVEDTASESSIANDYEHFVGTYTTEEQHRLPKEEWSDRMLKIELQNQQYYCSSVGGAKDLMGLAKSGLTMEEPGERFIFKFNPVTKTYQMEVWSQKDGALLKTWNLVKLAGPNSQVNDK
jgi:hypothetical protein